MKNPSFIGPLSRIILLGILLSACTTSPTSSVDSNPIQVNITVLSQSPELIFAINKPQRKTSFPGHVIYTIPEMDKVLLASELTYYEDLKVDIYYPPDFDFATKLPTVLIVHGFQEYDEFHKDMPQHIDWAKLIAASGMIAVSAQAADAPVENMFHLLDYLGANADFLGLDLTRIGFWACSGQGEPIFKVLEDKDLLYRDAFKAGLLFYPYLDPVVPADWPENIALFVVKAVKDQNIPATMIDNFVLQVRSRNISTVYIEVANAPHAFDVLQDSQAGKDTVKQALDFLTSILLP